MNEEEIEENKEIEEARNCFDEEIWPKIKSELKETTKREACFFCFYTGSMIMRNSIVNEIERAEKEIGKMSVEEIKKIIDGGSAKSEDLWEDKTKINGVWVDDKEMKEEKD